MVKKYAELYLDARRALLPTEGQFASNVARELICAASGKTAEQLISDRDLYASEEICELAQSFVRRRVAGEPMPYNCSNTSCAPLAADGVPIIFN